MPTGYVDRGLRWIEAANVEQGAPYPPLWLPARLQAPDENAVFNDEGASADGWSASAGGTMSSTTSYVRLTKDSGASSIFGSKTLGSWVTTDKDWLLYGKLQASRGTDHCGAIWFLSGSMNAGIWFGSTNASTAGYSDTALSIVGTTASGANRNTTTLGTGYAYDATPVDFVLHLDKKFGALHCYIKQSGEWVWKGGVQCEWFEPTEIQFALASVCPVGAYVEADYLTVCRPNLMSIGDSLCEGKTAFSPDLALGLSNATSQWQRYALAYPSLRNNLIVNKGVGGNTSAQILSRLAADVTSHGPRVVYLHASTNDYLAPITLADRTTNIQDTIDAIVAAGASVVLLNAVYGTSSNVANPGLRDYMLEWWEDYRPTLTGNFTTVDIMQPLLSGGYMDAALTQADNIHPTPAGYALVGAAVA